MADAEAESTVAGVFSDQAPPIPLSVFLDQIDREVFTRTDMHGAYLEGIKVGMKAVISNLPPGLLAEGSKQASMDRDTGSESEVEDDLVGEGEEAPVQAGLAFNTIPAATDDEAAALAALKAWRFPASTKDESARDIDSAPDTEMAAESSATPIAAPEKNERTRDPIRDPLEDDEAFIEDWEAGLTLNQTKRRVYVKLIVEQYRAQRAGKEAALDRGEDIDAPTSADSDFLKAKQEAYDQQMAKAEASYERWGLANMTEWDIGRLHRVVEFEEAGEKEEVPKTAKQSKNDRKKAERKALKALKKQGKIPGK